MGLLTPGVTQGLTEANLHMKYAGVAMRVYKKAELEGDEGVMKRAQGYATDSMKSAGESSKEAQEALREAQKEARKEAKAEQEAALEERRQEAAQERKEEKKKASEPKTDTVEISKEGQNGIKADHKDHNVSVEDQKESIVGDSVEPPDINNKSESVQGTYTAEGEMKPTTVDPQILLTI